MAFQTVGLRTIKRKKGTVYQIDYTLNGKRQRKVVGSNKKTAEAYQADIKAKLDRGELGIIEKKIISFDQLVTEYINLKLDSLRPKSVVRYKGFITEFKYFFSQYFAPTLNDITQIKSNYIQESIRNFRKKGATSKRPWSASSANSYKTFIATLFKFALKRDYVKSNPVSEIPDIKVEKNIKISFYKDDEVELILNKLPSDWSNFCKFLVLTGLRLGEAINLRWENIVLDNNQPLIYVLSNPEENWVTKTCTARKVPINNSVKSILLDQKKINNKYVFVKDDKQISEKAPLPILKKALKELNISGNIHQFRHTFGTRYLVRNKEFKAVYSLQKIMGHKDIKTTMQYVHLVDDYLHTSMNNLD